MPKKKLTPLTDPDNIMVIWDDEDEAPVRPAKKAAVKVAGPTTLPRRRS